MKEYQIYVTEKELEMIINAVNESSSKAWDLYNDTRDQNISNMLRNLANELADLRNKLNELKRGEEEW